MTFQFSSLKKVKQINQGAYICSLLDDKFKYCGNGRNMWNDRKECEDPGKQTYKREYYGLVSPEVRQVMTSDGKVVNYVSQKSFWITGIGDVYLRYYFFQIYLIKIGSRLTESCTIENLLKMSFNFILSTSWCIC